DGVQVQAPPAGTSTESTSVSSNRIVTVLPASAVPPIVGVVSFRLTPLAGLVSSGAAGAVVSTVNVCSAESGLTLPAASAADPFTVSPPRLSELGGVHVHVPPAGTSTESTPVSSNVI